MKMQKADEMEMSINFKAMKLSWAFGVLALFIWMVFDLIATGKLNPMQSGIVLLQCMIFFGSKIYLARKMSVDDDGE